MLPRLRTYAIFFLTGLGVAAIHPTHGDVVKFVINVVISSVCAVIIDKALNS